MKKSIGILGGMGPLATCGMMENIINNTEASKDQDYPRIYIDCNTNIPDRTNAILNNSENPVPNMVESAKKLQEIGADFIVMPCNTAHYFINDINKEIDIPILHMVEETAKYISNQNIKKIGLLATTGTIKSNLYTDFFKKYGVETILPSEKEQEYVMAMIYDGVKAGNAQFPSKDFETVVDSLKGLGAECMVLGCTEIPIVWERYNIEEKSVDPMIVISKVCVEKAGYNLKK